MSATNPNRKGRPQFRSRVVGLRYVRASELNPNPKNWRRHPSFQRKALDELLARAPSPTHSRRR